MIYAFQVCQCFHNDPGHVFIVEKHIAFFNYFYANAPSVLGSRFAYWKIVCISGPRVPPRKPSDLEVFPATRSRAISQNVQKHKVF